MTEHMYGVHSTKDMGETGKLGTAERSVTVSHRPVDGPGLSLPGPDKPVLPSSRLFSEEEEEEEEEKSSRENEEAERHTIEEPRVPSCEPFAPAGAAISQRAGSEVPKKTAEASDSSTTSARGEPELQTVEYLQEDLIGEVSALTAISVQDFMDMSDVHFGAMVHQSLRLLVSFCHLAARQESCDVADPADPTADRTKPEADHNQRKEEGAALLLELMQSAKQMLSVGMSLLHIFKQRRTWLEAVEEEGRNDNAAKIQDDGDEERRRTFLFILRSVITALKRFMAWRQGLTPPPAAPVVGRRQVSQDRLLEGDIHLQSPMEDRGEADEGELTGLGQLEALNSDFGEDSDSDQTDTTPIGKRDERQALIDSLGDDEDADVIIMGLMGAVADQEVPQLAEEVRRPLAYAPTADTVLHQGDNLRQLVDVLREACQIGAVPSWQDLAGLVMVLLRSSRGVAQFTVLSTRRRLLALECVVVRLVGEAVRHARGMARLTQIAAAAALQRNEDLVEAYSAAVHETRQDLRLRLGDLLSAVGQLLTAVHHEWLTTARPSSPRAPSSQSPRHPIGYKG